jgi:hypothetical protein
MEPYQWFLLGMMVAWLPGMIILAASLWCCDATHGTGPDWSPHTKYRA